MKKREYPFLLLSALFATSATSPGAWAIGTGLREPTPAELRALKNERVTHVRPNRKGLERINEERRRHGEAELPPTEAVEPGQDVSSEVSTTDSQILGASFSSSPTTTSSGTVGTFAGTTLPSSVDNSTLASFPPIRSQGGLNSCVAFSATYYQLTHNTGLARGWANNNLDNTTKFSPKWAYNFINNGVDQGAYFSDVYKLLEKHGAPMWADFPYDANLTAWDLNTQDWIKAASYRAGTVQYISNFDTTGLTTVKQLLTNGYVLVFGTYINSWQYTTVKNDPATSADDAYVGKPAVAWVDGTLGGHAMTIVGFNDDLWIDLNGNGIVDAGEKGALRVANSWGPTWGDGGFIWLAYDALKAISGVAGGPYSASRVAASQSNMAMHLPVRASYTPKLFAAFTVSHAARSQLSLAAGISETNATVPTTSWTPAAINAQGGALAFDGSTTPVAAKFAYDISDLAPTGTTTQRYYLTLKDSALSAPATLSSFSVIDMVRGGAETPLSAGLPVAADNSSRVVYLDYTFWDGNQAPSAVISASTTQGNAPLTVTFDGRGSADPDGTIASYAWSFSDGTAMTGAVVSKTFGAGQYTVTLTVTDDKGTKASTQTTVTAVAVPDTAAPVVTITSPTEGATVSRTVSVSARATDDVGVVKAVLYVDGALTSTATSAPFTTSWNAKFASSGYHTLQVWAYDRAGNIGKSPIVNVRR